MGGYGSTDYQNLIAQLIDIQKINITNLLRNSKKCCTFVTVIQDVTDIQDILKGLKAEIVDLKQMVSDQGSEISRLKRLCTQKDARIAKLENEKKSLKNRLSKYEKDDTPEKDSHNSSIPPSQESIAAKNIRHTTSLREKSNRPNGGQPGHKGFTIKKCVSPDIVEDYMPPVVCEHCGRHIEDIPVKQIGTSQVIDLPIIKPIVTEQRFFSRKCSCGHDNWCDRPSTTSKYVSYGPMVRSLVCYLSHVQCIAFNRIKETLRDVFGIDLSEGTIRNILEGIASKAQPVYEMIRKRIETSHVVGGDETGEYVNGELHWAWTFQNDLLTYVFQDKSRGEKAVHKHFPNDLPNSMLITDRHSTYFTMDVAGHQVCLSHLLRNATYLDELDKTQTWSKRFKNVLKHAIKLRKTKIFSNITQNMKRRIESRMRKLLSENLSKLHEDFATFQKGIMKCQDYLFTFLYDPEVPYDNNGSERAVRKIKVKQKVSGCFRTDEGADAFMILHSITETAKKNGQSKLQALLTVAQQ